jgi:hypothetical protein
MNKTVATILGVVLVLAIAGGSFYGGMLYGKSQALSAVVSNGLTFRAGDGMIGAGPAVFSQAVPGQAVPEQVFSGQGGPGFGGRVQRGQFGEGNTGGSNLLIGTIKAIGDGQLVLADTNGNETAVKVTDTTLIEKNASVELTDLKPGEALIVSGSTGDDGSVTARSVQVAPPGRFGAGAPASGAPNAPAAPEGSDAVTGGAAAPPATPAE